jgi:hypothetical protein
MEHKRLPTPCHVCSKPYDGTGRWRKRISNSSCSNCLGTGEEPISVRPMHKAPDAAREQADDVALVRFARTSRQVGKVHDVAPLLAEVLQAFYGDEGQRCELAPNGLRCDALHPFTEPGRELRQAVEDLHTGSLRELREKAREAALELYVVAARAWNMQARPKRDVLALRRLAGALAELGYSDLATNIRKANT